MDAGVHFPMAKRPDGEADYSIPTSADVMNAWSYTSTPHPSYRRGA